MSLINTQVKPFKATAFHNGKFVPVDNETIAGKWSVFVFYPADFTFTGTPAQRYERIARSVAPPLYAAHGAALVDALQGARA